MLRRGLMQRLVTRAARSWGAAGSGRSGAWLAADAEQKLGFPRPAAPALLQGHRLRVAPPYAAAPEAWVRAGAPPQLVHAAVALSCRALHQSAAAHGASGGASAELANKKHTGLAAWLLDQALHLWHGFRLLAVDTRVAVRLKHRVFSGQKLTRRETLLLERTTQDLLRLVPFSFFVLLPGGELLLPIALAMFPDMIPSTFITAEKRRMKHFMKKLDGGGSRRRLMAHMTSCILWAEELKSEAASLTIARDVMRGSALSEESIRTFTPYFKSKGPLALDKMPLYVLKDLTKLTNTFSYLEHWLLPRAWQSVRMKFVLARYLEAVEVDDACLAKAGVDMLTRLELESECAKRRMFFFLPKEALRAQLKEWLNLSLDPNVPNHMLMFLSPIAVSSEAVMAALTKEERDHILGLEGYKDAPFYELLHGLTRKASTDAPPQNAKEAPESVMKLELEELKQRIVDTSEEAAATEAQFCDVEPALRGVTDQELTDLFLTAAASSETTHHGDGTLSVDPKVLSRALADFYARRSGVSGGITEERLLEYFREFDTNSDGCISKEEFVANIHRICG